MKLEELRTLVAQGESTTLEFKASTGARQDAAKTIAAMLGQRGGHVLFGVTDDGEIVGQTIGLRTLEDLASEFKHISPQPFPDIEAVHLEAGKVVIAVGVPRGAGPYMYRDQPYHRQGRVTVKMSREEFERRLVEKRLGETWWENQTAEGITIDDLDAAEIVRTVEEAIRRGRMEDPGTRSPLELLHGLRLIEEDRILNAAVVLFAKSERLGSRFPQLLLRMARLSGVSITDDFLDNRQEYGNIFDLLLRGQRFLRDHLPIASRVVPGLFERMDDPLYPPIVLREAMANAFCHRDYFVGGSSVSLAIFDDRLEVANTGTLPFGLTISDVVRSHGSRPRNPLIAEVLYRRGIIEKWGSGIAKMVDSMRLAGLPAPEFTDEADQVKVTLRPSRYLAPSRIGVRLSPLQRTLLEIVGELGPVPLAKILKLLEAPVPSRTVQANLRTLGEIGQVELKGHGAGARWLLKGVTDGNTQ